MLEVILLLLKIYLRKDKLFCELRTTIIIMKSQSQRSLKHRKIAKGFPKSYNQVVVPDQVWVGA